MESKKITKEDFLPNTTAVPNVVLDWMMADLSPSQFKVLMFFIRQRYGFQLFSGEFEYSIHEIMDGLTTRITRPDGSHEIRRVCAGTGLKKDAVIQAIRDLSADKAVRITRKGNRRITHKFQMGLLDDFKPDAKSLVVKTIQKKSLDDKTDQTLGGNNHQKEQVLDGKTVPLGNQVETKLENNTTVSKDPGNTDNQKVTTDPVPLDIKKDHLAGPENILWEYFKECHKSKIPTKPIMDWFPFKASVIKHLKGGMDVDELKKMMDVFFNDPFQAKLGFPQKNFWGGLSKYAMEAGGVIFEQPTKLSQNQIEYQNAMKRLEEKHEREKVV